LYLCTRETTKRKKIMSIDTYKLTSTEEPTDEVLQALMEKVAQAARESNAKAEAEKRRRLQTVADEIKEWKRKIRCTTDGKPFKRYTDDIPLWAQTIID